MIVTKQAKSHPQQVTHSNFIDVTYVKEFLDSLILNFKVYQNEPKQLDFFIQELERFVFTSNPDADVNQYITDEQRIFLNQMYCKWEIQLEAKLSKDILSDKTSRYQDYALYDRLEILANREAELLDFQPQKIAFIGGGPLPITGIVLSQRFQQPIDCFDCCGDAIKISKALIHKLGLEDKVRLLYGNGTTIDVRQYDLIMIALLAKPKWAILRNIRKQNPACPVLCRTSHDWRVLVYESTPSKHFQHNYIVRQINRAVGKQTISTLLLEPNCSIQSQLAGEWFDYIDQQMRQSILDLIRQVTDQEAMIGFPQPLSVVHAQQLIDQANQSTQFCNFHSLVVKDRNQIVAYTILKADSSLNSSHWVEIYYALIHPNYHGANLIKFLGQKIVTYCEKLGCEKLKIKLFKENYLLRKVKNFGFIEYGELEDDARISEQSYTSLYLYQSVESLRKKVFT